MGAKTTTDEQVMTLGDVARELGIQLWQVRRLYERGLLPEPPRVAGARVVRREELAKIEAALKEAGYLAG